MNGTKEAPDCAATQTEAMAETTERTEKSTVRNSTTGTGTVARFLRQGEENATTTAILLTLTNLKSSRQLQNEIEAERKRGIPILTKPGPDGGYFLPSEDTAAAIQECRNFVHFMRAKGLGCFRSARAAKKLLVELQRQVSGQQDLFTGE